MSNFSDDLAYLITTANLAKRGVSLFLTAKAVIPSGDGPYTSIIETGGSGSEYVQNQTAPAYHMPSAQLFTRARSSETALATSREIFDTLVSVNNQIVNGTWYLWIRAIQLPHDLAVDDKERAVFVFNVQGMKRP